MLYFLRSRLSPFKHRDFRYFFFVQTLSLTGQWSHDLARAWIVLELMQKATALGSMQMAIAVPSLFFILQGGVVVDRSNIKAIMMITKGILGLAALALAFITEFSDIKFWMLLAFGLLEGAVMGFDLPAYQALTVRLVPREDFQQALAINSTNFHASRMLGPLVAGGLMVWHGPSLVFLFDAVTYLVLIYILSKINLREIQRSPKALTQSRWESLIEGIRYIRFTPMIFSRVTQLFLTISLIVPLLMVVFRTYVKDKYTLTADEFAFVFALASLGSMLGALSFTFIKPKKPIKALWFGVPGLVAGSCILPAAGTPLLAGLVMAFTGFCMYLSLASLTVSLHLNVDEDYRGRLGSVIGLGFISIGPLMGLPLGAYADKIGFDPAIYSIALVFLIGSAFLAWFHSRRVKELKEIHATASHSEPNPVLSPPVEPSVLNDRTKTEERL